MGSSSSTQETDMSRSEAETLVQELVQEYPVMVFSKTWCGYCSMAKRALDSVNADYNVIELDEREDGRAIQNAIARLYHYYTVPSVFIGGQHVGGGQETQALLRRKKLKKMIDAANDEYADRN